MGQAITTMLWRFLGTEAGKSLLSDEEDSGTSSFFGRCWEMGEAFMRFLRRLLSRKPPQDAWSPDGLQLADDADNSYNMIMSSPDHHHFIDVGIDNDEADSYETDGDIIIIKIIQEAEMEEPPPPISSKWGRLGPYSWVQKILLVGEGDFSFSTSLAVAFGDASNIISTSLDSFEFLMKNYSRALSNILELTSKGCKVMHGVDATKMVNHPQLRSFKFDRIVYNFPHAGFANRDGPREAQISMHQRLVRGFLANAKKMITDNGQVHITHKCKGFFLEWNIEKLGSTEGLRLIEEAPFNFRDFPGYSTKFGYGGDAYFNCWPSRTYKFQLAIARPRSRDGKENKRIR